MLDNLALWSSSVIYLTEKQTIGSYKVISFRTSSLCLSCSWFERLILPIFSLTLIIKLTIEWCSLMLSTVLPSKSANNLNLSYKMKSQLLTTSNSVIDLKSTLLINWKIAIGCLFAFGSSHSFKWLYTGATRIFLVSFTFWLRLSILDMYVGREAMLLPHTISPLVKA